MQTNDDLIAVRDLRAGTAEPTDIAGRPGATPGSVHTRRSGSGVVGFAPLDARGGRRRGRDGARHRRRRGRAAGPGQRAVAMVRRRRSRPLSRPRPAGTVLPIDMSVTPVVVPAGAYLYVAHSFDGYRHEMWLEVEGGIVVAIVRADGGRRRDVSSTRSATRRRSPTTEPRRRRPGRAWPTPRPPSSTRSPPTQRRCWR